MLLFYYETNILVFLKEKETMQLQLALPNDIPIMLLATEDASSHHSGESHFIPLS